MSPEAKKCDDIADSAERAIVLPPALGFGPSHDLLLSCSVLFAASFRGLLLTKLQLKVATHGKQPGALGSKLGSKQLCRCSSYVPTFATGCFSHQHLTVSKCVGK